MTRAVTPPAVKWIERHPSLRWYVPLVVTASLVMQIWEAVR